MHETNSTVFHFNRLRNSNFCADHKPEIITDRPDQTEASAIVPKGGIQVELGTQIENDVVQDVKVTNYTYTTALIKYGVNEHFELRLNTEFLGERTRNGESNISKVNGISPLALRVKIKLADENKIWPQTSFMGYINLKSGSSEFARIILPRIFVLLSITP